MLPPLTSFVTTMDENAVLDSRNDIVYLKTLCMARDIYLALSVSKWYSVKALIQRIRDVTGWRGVPDNRR